MLGIISNKTIRLSLFLLSTLFLIVACGGGSSGDGGDTPIADDPLTTNVNVDLLFPTPGSDVGRGYATTTTVMCKFIHIDQKSVQVNSATANGVALSETPSGSGIWYAQINTSAGQNTLTIEADIESEGKVSTQFNFNNNGAMRSPQGLAIHTSNNKAYVVDSAHDSLLSVDLTSGQRVVISDAQIGTGDTLFWPRKVKLNSTGTSLLVTDRWERTLFDINLNTGNRSAVNNNTGAAQGVELHPASNTALIATSVNTAIYSIDFGTGVSSILANDSTGTGGPLGRPYDIDADSNYAQYVIASQWPNSLFTFDPSSGDRTVLASSTIGTGSSLGAPNAVTWQPNNTDIWVADSSGVLAINVSTQTRTRLLTTSYNVLDIALDTTNNRLLLADAENAALYAMNNNTNTTSIFIDGSVGQGQHFNYPRSASYDPSGRFVYVGDSSTIYKVDLATGDRSVVSSQTVGVGPQLYDIYDIAIDSSNNLLYLVNLNTLFKVDLSTGNRTVVSNTTTGTGPSFSKASGLKVDVASQVAWLIDYQLEAVLQVDLLTGDRFILSDNITNGIGQQFNFPFAIVWDAVNSRLLVSEGDGTRIVAVNLNTGDRSILSDTTNTGPAMRSIREMSLDASRNRVLVVTNSGGGNNSDILAVDLTSGNRSPISQPSLGSGPLFRDTEGLSVDTDNNRVFVLDTGDGTHALVNVSMQTGDRVIVSQ